MRKAAFPLAVLLAAGSAPARSDATAPAAPHTPAGIAVAYRIAFWGIPFGATSYEAKFGESTYAASSHFETSGIVSLFWQATIDATISGRIQSGTIVPAVYDSFARRSSTKKQRVSLIFGENGVTTIADPPYDTKKYPVTEAQKRGAVDPMSAIALVLAGVTADGTNPCGAVAPVFDGRRRYDIAFTYLHDEPESIGKLFHGSAHLCRVHYRQIAGFKQKILREGAALPPIYGIFADIPAAGAPNGHYVVALRLWADPGWGTVSATLARLQVTAGNAMK